MPECCRLVEKSLDEDKVLFLGNFAPEFNGIADGGEVESDGSGDISPSPFAAKDCISPVDIEFSKVLSRSANSLMYLNTNDLRTINIHISLIRESLTTILNN